MHMEYQPRNGIGVLVKTRKVFSKTLLTICLILFLFAGCAQNTGPCPTQPYADLSEADRFAGDYTLPFRFPLDDANPYRTEKFTKFCTPGRNKLDAPYSYHAAEDYFQLAGTPVYAWLMGKSAFPARRVGMAG